jgi:DNA-binding ferritin-like protein
MSQSDSPPVIDPTQIDFPPEICAYLTTLLHQTLACTGGLRSHVAQVSWDVQGQEVFRWPTIFAAMTAALDAYTDLVAERLAMLDRMEAGHDRHDDLAGEAASVSRRHGGG